MKTNKTNWPKPAARNSCGYAVYLTKAAHGMLRELKAANGWPMAWQLETAVREFYERRMPAPKAADTPTAAQASATPPPSPARK